jgi:phosphate transport system ATP-binding protein
MTDALSPPEPDDEQSIASTPRRNGHPRPATASFSDAGVVQLVAGAAEDSDALVATLHPAVVTVTPTQVAAVGGPLEWSWMVDELSAVVHSPTEPWTIFVVPDVTDFGVEVAPSDVERFREALSQVVDVPITYQSATPEATTPADATSPVDAVPDAAARAPSVIPAPAVAIAPDHQSMVPVVPAAAGGLAGLQARHVSAWFGSRLVLDRVSLDMPAGMVTALIGPSGCGKSTFLRVLNRMHEMTPSASLAGEVMLDGHDIYDPSRRVTDARREIGMVFQKPNPFPAMSIYDNVVASLRLTGRKGGAEYKDHLVETCLRKAGLWNEVRDRLRAPGAGLSGGQQQRLCIARALAIQPRVLLMDEPCSALDPTSTRRIEETIRELVDEVTIVIVTHNMQQAARVSNQCAFFLAEQGTPGVIVEHGPTDAMFGSPQDPRTDDYVNGRFG